MKRAKLLITALVCLFLTTACHTPKNITYLQGFETTDIQKIRAQGRIKFQADDRISIIVNARDPELANMFNLSVVQRYAGGVASTSNVNTSIYTVTPDGYINFPILGKFHVAGLERSEVADLITRRLIKEDLLKDPIVTVEFYNATVSVLGDVKNPGEYEIDRDNLNIFQALSKAGDLNITGERTNVLVVREENGRDKAYRIDLTNPESTMQSPAYYLQQNDIVYVEPNNVKKRQATVNGSTVLTPAFWLSVASLLTTISVLVFK